MIKKNFGVQFDGMKNIKNCITENLLPTGCFYKHLMCIGNHTWMDAKNWSEYLSDRTFYKKEIFIPGGCRESKIDSLYGMWLWEGSSCHNGSQHLSLIWAALTGLCNP